MLLSALTAHSFFLKSTTIALSFLFSFISSSSFKLNSFPCFHYFILFSIYCCVGGMTAFYQKKKDAKKNKSDVNWNRHVVPDSVLRKKYTEEQKTADAYDRFKSAGVKPLENHDDDDDEVENDEDDEDNRSQESSVVSSESDEELLVNKPKQKPRVSTTNRERERDREGEDEGDSYREREREGDRAPQHPRKLPPLEADSGKSYR